MKQILFISIVALALATAGFSQRGPGGQGRGGPADAAATLKTALNATDAQITAIQTLMTTRRQRADAIFSEIEPKRQALDTLLNAAAPNPTDVGNAAIALRTSERKLDAEKDWYIAELKKILTADQQQTLATLIAGNTRSPVLGVLGLGGPGGPRGEGGPGRPGGPGNRGPRQ